MAATAALRLPARSVACGQNAGSLFHLLRLAYVGGEVFTAGHVQGIREKGNRGAESSSSRGRRRAEEAFASRFWLESVRAPSASRGGTREDVESVSAFEFRSVESHVDIIFSAPVRSPPITRFGGRSCPLPRGKGQTTTSPRASSPTGAWCKTRHLSKAKHSK